MTSNVTALPRGFQKKITVAKALSKVPQQEKNHGRKKKGTMLFFVFFLKFCTKLKDPLLPQMGCKMPVRAAFHPRLSRAQQPDDERLYSYGLTTNRFFSSYSALKLPFGDKGQNVLNATVPYDPNYHVKTFKISWTRHDHWNKKQRQLRCLEAFIAVAGLRYQLGSGMYASWNNSALT